MTEQRVEELLGNLGDAVAAPRAARRLSAADLFSLDVPAPVGPKTLLQSEASCPKHVVDLVVANRRAIDPDAEPTETGRL